MATDFIVPDWPAPARVRAVMTTRAGGVSAGAYASLNLGVRCGDDLGAVAANRARLRRRLALPEEPAWLRQVHGSRVVTLPAAVEAEADAAVAHGPGPVCAVLAADCLPVLLCDRDATVVAAAHAGWRGLAAGVIENTVAATDRPPQELMAWLGAAIGAQAFEVGADVVGAFAADAAAFRPAARRGRWLADIHALARARLQRCGVNAVFGGGRCTVAEPEIFFSHRREGPCGRMAALIWLQPPAAE